MKWFTNIIDIKEARSVVSVGNFDGLHKGHLKVVNQLVKRAKELDAVSVVFTFWPHPQEVLFPDKDIYYLSTFQEKILQFSKTGIDYLVLYPFDKKFSQLSYQQFIKQYLVDTLKMNFFVIGYDHHFGKDREGNLKKLQSYAKQYNFGVERVEEEVVVGEIASSTEIRNAIKRGEIQKANNLLGYIYSLSGKVKKGKGIGQKIDFPTLNIEVQTKKLLPQKAVYISLVSYKNKKYKAICNIGYNPTVNADKQLRLEVHVLDFEKDIYGEDVKISFLRKIREEKKFENLLALQEQIKKDKQICLQYFEQQK